MLEPRPEDENRDGIVLSGETQTLPEYIKGTPPRIEELRRRAEEARSDAKGRRIKSKKARAYYDGPGQLDSDVRRVLDTRKQPAIYTNRVRPAVNGILGVLEQGRSDPQAYPRNPDDQDSADVVTKILRFVADQSNFGSIKLDVADNHFVEGSGAVIVEMDGEEITPTQIRWEEHYADPFSRRHDFMDARFQGIAKWVDADMIRKSERWKDRLAQIGDPLNGATEGLSSSTYEDRGDNGAGWINTTRRRVLLCEEYALEEGEWKRLVYIGCGVLEYDTSPYLDEKGRPCNPIEATSCYVDEDNGRYGIVDDMIPIQDEINASRSRSLHLMNSRQVTFDPNSGGNPVDSDIAKQEASKADGALPFGWSIIQTSDMTQANMLRNQEAKGEIERMGPTPAVLGRNEGASQSGRARLVSQQAGLTELSRPIGRLSDWELRVYRQIWARAKQFKTDEWFIRTTDDTRAPEFMKANQPVKLKDALEAAGEGDQKAQQAIEQIIPANVMQAAKAEDPEAIAIFQQMTQAYGEMTVMIRNRIAEMDVDIILDTVQDTATLAQEVWAELVQLVGQAGGLEAVYSPAFELMIEASPLADKTRVIELIKKGRDEQQNNQVQTLTQQVQQLQEQLQAKQQTTEAQVGADVQHKQAQAALAGAKAQQIGVETEKSALDALMANHLQEEPQTTL